MIADRWLDKVSQGVHWWWDGVIGCIPNQVARYFAECQETLWLNISNKEPSISYRFAGLEGCADDLTKLQEILGSKARRQSEYELLVEVDREEVFSRTVEVPAAEVNQLDTYINRHFSEICPYEPSTVVFQSAIRSANIESGSVQVDVAFIFKDFVKRCRQVQLAEVPPQEGAIYTQNDGNRIWLHRWKAKSSASAIRNAIIVIALLLAILLPAVALKYVQSQLNAQYLTLSNEQQRIKTEMNEYLVLLESADKLEVEERALAKIQRRSQAIRAVLDNVADVLPTSSWLQKLELTGDDLQISGYGVATAKLPQILEQSKSFHSVQLSAPIVPDPITGKDRFSIQMKVDWELISALPTTEERF